MTELDARGLAVPQAGAAIIARYNEAQAGDRFAALVDRCSAELRMWLLEAGARHSIEALDKGSRITVERSASPAQGSIPGLHHVVTDGSGNVWACERGRHVVRIDVSSNGIAAVACVARKASHLALDAARGILIVADPGSNQVLALAAADLALVHAWAVPGMPQLPLITPDGIVCATGGGSSTLTIARPRRIGYELQVVNVGRAPHDPLLAGDGLHVFVPCAGSGEIVKVRLRDGAIAGRCTVGDGPAHLAAHPDGTRIYSANSWDGSVSCLTAEGELVRTVESGGWAHAIDIQPDGAAIWVANFFDDTLAVFDAVTLERLALLETERYAHGVDVSPDGRHVVATGFSSDCVRLFDARTRTQTARIAVGRGSSHTAFVGARAYVGCSVSDHVAAVDLQRRESFAAARLRDEVTQ